jgi:hypothetical protein
VTSESLELPLLWPANTRQHLRRDLVEELAAFREFGEATRVLATRSATFDGQPIEVPTFVNEFWTARQRQASSLHEVSYRACFKPQLPRFFIERLTVPGERVRSWAAARRPSKPRCSDGCPRAATSIR